MKKNQTVFTVKPFLKKIEKPWGYELILTPENFKVTGKILHLNAGCRFSYQYHDQKEEMLCLIKGEAKIIIDDQEIIMDERKGYLIRPTMKHRVAGITDCEIMEASTPEQGNTFRLEDDYSRPTETESLRKLPNRGWEKKEPAHEQKNK